MAAGRRLAGVEERRCVPSTKSDPSEAAGAAGGGPADVPGGEHKAAGRVDGCGCGRGCRPVRVSQRFGGAGRSARRLREAEQDLRGRSGAWDGFAAGWADGNVGGAFCRSGYTGYWNSWSFWNFWSCEPGCGGRGPGGSGERAWGKLRGSERRGEVRCGGVVSWTEWRQYGFDGRRRVARLGRRFARIWRRTVWTVWIRRRRPPIDGFDGRRLAWAVGRLGAIWRRRFAEVAADV